MYILLRDENKEKIINQLKKIDPKLKVSCESFIDSKVLIGFASERFNPETYVLEWGVLAYTREDNNNKVFIPLKDIYTIYCL